MAKIIQPAISGIRFKLMCTWIYDPHFSNEVIVNGHIFSGPTVDQDNAFWDFCQFREPQSEVEFQLLSVLLFLHVLLKSVAMFLLHYFSESLK